MGIQVTCPHGHAFKVKDKYAGKRGLCPRCPGQVVVEVPTLQESHATEEAFRKAVIEEHRAEHAAPPVPTGGSSVLDDQPSAQDSGTSGSLLGSSVLRHNVKCGCGASVPMWFAKCPSCGTFLQNR